MRIYKMHTRTPTQMQKSLSFSFTAVLDFYSNNFWRHLELKRC